MLLLGRIQVEHTGILRKGRRFNTGKVQHTKRGRGNTSEGETEKREKVQHTRESIIEGETEKFNTSENP